MERQPILVLGATGSTGRRVAGLLRAAGHPVRAASRGGEVRFDWADPASWPLAVGPATAMYLMAPDGVPVDPAFVAVAAGRGVERIVLLSSGAVEEMGDERLLSAERAVRESGAEWTVLRPSWFHQNFSEGFLREPVMSGEIALPLGDLRQAFVDAADIAATAVTALTTDGHHGRTYDLTGPRALTFAEATEIVARASGREIRYVGDPETYAARQHSLGRPPAEVSAEIAAFTALRRRGDDKPTDVVERLTGHPPKDLVAYATETAARGAWRD
ncbi:NmrA family transcriptional regulator [Sphaerisporangium sp. B11E5]|uniref:NmrA family transcriptional regulator n=1 Tax=Sphaerisporangium sp. B11E5 TaxID=3153563 RepID=UPI00325E23C8